MFPKTELLPKVLGSFTLPELERRLKPITPQDLEERQKAWTPPPDSEVRKWDDYSSSGFMGINEDLVHRVSADYDMLRSRNVTYSQIEEALRCFLKSKSGLHQD